MAASRRKKTYDTPLSAEALKAGAEEIFLTENELAARWKRRAKTLRNWRSAGLGPAYHRLGRHIRYSLTTVLRYEEEARLDP